MSHRIRLNARWKLVREGEESSIDLPFRDAEGSAFELRRAFGRPTGLSETERVWLRFEGASGEMVVTLNGARLESAACEWDVTDRLSGRNELRIQVSRGMGLDAVVIEIR